MDTNYTAQTENQAPAAPQPNEKPVSTGAFFGLELLLAIPVIGLIAAIIFSFAPKNNSLRNYARAKLIWCVISILITVLLIVGLLIAAERFAAYINEEYHIDITDRESIGELLEQAEELGALAGFAGQLGDAEDIDALIGQLGDAEDIDAFLEDIGGMENIGEVIEQAGGIENVEEIIEEAGGIENVGEIINGVGGAENIGKLAEQIKNPEIRDNIVEDVSGIENIEQAIEDVGGMERLEDMDSIGDAAALIGEIEDPAVKEQLWDIFKKYTGQ